MLGAAALSALAAMRSGAGLVTVGVPRGLNKTLQAKLTPVVMTWPLPDTSGGGFAASAWRAVRERLSIYRAVAVGPGLGRSAGAAVLTRKLVAGADRPVVVDADGLNHLTAHLEVLRRAAADRVLTPHPGEFSRLTGLSKEEIRRAPRRHARRFALEQGCFLVLKGHRSLVVTPQGRVSVNRTGNVGMATAGSGDVLTGMIVALLGQGIETGRAVRTAVFLHGLAGDLAAERRTRTGMTAMDIVEAIPEAIRAGEKNRSTG